MWIQPASSPAPLPFLSLSLCPVRLLQRGTNRPNAEKIGCNPCTIACCDFPLICAQICYFFTCYPKFMLRRRGRSAKLRPHSCSVSSGRFEAGRSACLDAWACSKSNHHPTTLDSSVCSTECHFPSTNAAHQILS